jgi:hypothetical protein
VGEEEEEGCKLSVSFYSRYKNTDPPSHDSTCLIVTISNFISSMIDKT